MSTGLEAHRTGARIGGTFGDDLRPGRGWLWVSRVGLADRLINSFVNEISTRVGRALLPVQVADVGQEWPTYSNTDKP
jgi:hypothetical protein